MKMETYFSVIARCKTYEKDKEEPDLTAFKEDIELKFNEITAASFLFKFGPDSFKLNEYKAICKYNEKNNLVGLCLIDDKYFRIVTNFAQIRNDIHEGYLRLKCLEKISDLLEFDFKAGIDIQNPVDEEF